MRRQQPHPSLAHPSPTHPLRAISLTLSYTLPGRAPRPRRSPTPPSRRLAHPRPRLASVPLRHLNIPSRSRSSIHPSDERTCPRPLLPCVLPHHPDIPSFRRSPISSPSCRLTIPVIRTAWPGTSPSRPSRAVAHPPRCHAVSPILACAPHRQPLPSAPFRAASPP
jgi:hypothetical protein